MNSLESLQKLAEAHHRLAGVYETACADAAPILQEISDLADGLAGSTPAVETTKTRATKKSAASASTSKKTAAGKPRKRPKNDLPLPDLVVKILSEEGGKEGMKLGELAKAVIASGYQTSSKKAKSKPTEVYTQLVYQAVRKLLDREPKAYVGKHADTKRYYLTAEGKKAA
jgi:hypothetical protein